MITCDPPKFNADGSDDNRFVVLYYASNTKKEIECRPRTFRSKLSTKSLALLAQFEKSTPYRPQAAHVKVA